MNTFTNARQHMPNLLRAFVLTVGITFGADHFEACRTSVIAENNFNMLAVMGGKHGCTFPRTPGQSYHDDTITVTKAILVWLNDHQASLKPKTSDAIHQAKTALWPKECR
jgi:hypothetical protein